jgi:peptidoglycan hydrolase CwlO-like protein
MDAADAAAYSSLEEESSSYSSEISGLQEDIAALQRRIDKIDAGLSALSGRRGNFVNVQEHLVKTIARKQAGVKANSASGYHTYMRSYANGKWQPRALDGYDGLASAAQKGKARLEEEIREKQSQIDSCYASISSLSDQMSDLMSKAS